MKKEYWWVIAAGVIIVMGGIVLFHGTAKAPSTNGNTQTATTTDASGVSITTTGGTGNVKVISNVANGNPAIPHPAISDTVTISAPLSPEATAQLRAHEQGLITQLKAAPTRVDLWLLLGDDRKMAGDYAGAIAAWNYVATAGPSSINFIADGNLGDLYMNFMASYPKAETSYKAAIAIKPTYIDYYRDLALLYQSFYKTNIGAAHAIIAQGLKANPNDPTLLAIQASLQPGQ